MSIVNKHKSAENITTPAANYTTLFFDENGDLFGKRSDGTLVRFSPAGDASGVTYAPDNSLIWTDSVDPGNVAEALDDLALRLNEVESNEYQPADLNDWREQEDPGRTDDALDQLANRMLVLESLSPVDVQTGSYLVSGGGVVWNGGYDYTVSAAVYFISGTQYESAQDDVSLSLADATFDRIDVIAVNTAGEVVVIEGTPASNPAKPEVNSDSQLELSFVFVAAASVAAEITEEVIYEESAEWTDVSNSANIVVNSATTPFAGTLVIEATSAVSGNAVTFTDSALNTLGDYSALTMQVRSKASWPNQKRLNFQWRNGGVLVGSAVALRTGVYGFTSATTGVYQSVTIPMADFGVGTQQADELVMSISGGGGAIGFFVDNIILQAGTTGGGTTVAPAAMLFRSAWSSSTSYDEQDVVTYLGNTYVCILANSNNTPPNTTYWSPLLVEAANVAYTPQTSLHWTDSEDPGQVDDALDDLAARVNALEENPGGGGITDAADLTYTPTTLADWTGGVDPGDGQEAFDQLAGRVTDLEAAGSSAGRHAIYIAAGSITPSATGGCAALATIASAANQPDIQTLDFDATTQEYAQFSIRMPKSWNEGTVTFVPVWSHAATTTNFGVVWDLQAVAVSNDDAIAVAFGTAQTSTDTGGTTDDIYIGPESSAITVSGTPAAEDVAFFRVSRVTGDGSDTMAIDARLHGITLYITTDASNDA